MCTAELLVCSVELSSMYSGTSWYVQWNFLVCSVDLLSCSVDLYGVFIKLPGMFSGTACCVQWNTCTVLTISSAMF